LLLNFLGPEEKRHPKITLMGIGSQGKIGQEENRRWKWSTKANTIYHFWPDRE
jgi:hypothetical protein